MLTERPVNDADDSVTRNSPESENTSNFTRVIIIANQEDPTNIRAVIVSPNSADPEAAYLFQQISAYQEMDRELLSQIHYLNNIIQSDPNSSNAKNLKAQLKNIELQRTGYLKTSKGLNPSQTQLNLVILQKQDDEIIGWTTKEFSENTDHIEEQSDWWRVFLTKDQTGVQALRIYQASPPHIQSLVQEYYKIRKNMQQKENPDFTKGRTLFDALSDEEADRITRLIEAISKSLNTAKP